MDAAAGLLPDLRLLLPDVDSLKMILTLEDIDGVDLASHGLSSQFDLRCRWSPAAHPEILRIPQVFLQFFRRVSKLSLSLGEHSLKVRID